jgi:thiamine-phosphate pyrophosphorylase
MEVGDIASLLIASGPAQKEMARKLLGPAQARNVAVLIEADIDLTKGLRADGIMIGENLKDYTAARAALGAQAIVGAKCTSRHGAMELAEAGVDVIAFADPALVSWWSEISVVPCIALQGGEDAEFVTPSPRMWSGPTETRTVIAETMSHAP